MDIGLPKDTITATAGRRRRQGKTEGNKLHAKEEASFKYSQSVD